MFGLDECISENSQFSIAGEPKLHHAHHLAVTYTESRRRRFFCTRRWRSWPEN